MRASYPEDVPPSADPLEPLVTLVVRSIARVVGQDPAELPVEVEAVVRGALHEAYKRGRRKPKTLTGIGPSE